MITCHVVNSRARKGVKTHRVNFLDDFSCFHGEECKWRENLIFFLCRRSSSSKIKFQRFMIRWLKWSEREFVTSLALMKGILILRRINRIIAKQRKAIPGKTFRTKFDCFIIHSQTLFAFYVSYQTHEQKFFCRVCSCCSRGRAH